MKVGDRAVFGYGEESAVAMVDDVEGAVRALGDPVESVEARIPGYSIGDCSVRGDTVDDRGVVGLHYQSSVVEADDSGRATQALCQ